MKYFCFQVELYDVTLFKGKASPTEMQQAVDARWQIFKTYGYVGPAVLVTREIKKDRA